MKGTVDWQTKKDPGGMSLSESIDPGQSKALDEVRAKIFYLASDVETASQPAAMLLRAVAESIVEIPEAAEHFNGHAALNGLAMSLQYHRGGAIRPPAPRVPNSVPPPPRHIGESGTRTGHKR